MNPKPLSQARDEDSHHILAALERAALRAREIGDALATGLIDSQALRESNNRRVALSLEVKQLEVRLGKIRDELMAKSI